jgi:hypothetical protein
LLSLCTSQVLACIGTLCKKTRGNGGGRPSHRSRNSSGPVYNVCIPYAKDLPAPDRYVRYGKILIDFYQSLRHADVEIRERITRMKMIWMRTTTQLDFVSAPDEAYRFFLLQYLVYATYRLRFKGRAEKGQRRNTLADEEGSGLKKFWCCVSRRMNPRRQKRRTASGEGDKKKLGTPNTTGSWKLSLYSLSKM